MFEKEAKEYLKKLLKRLKIKEEDLAENQPEILSWEKMNFISLNVSNVSEAFQAGAEFGYNKVKKELEEEKKLNAEIKARFVKCNTCTDEMKSMCIMFTENICECERCEELIDIVSLVNKSDLERKIEELEKANEWHYPSKGELPKEDKRYLCKIKAFVGSGITYECF